MDLKIGDISKDYRLDISGINQCLVAVTLERIATISYQAGNFIGF